MQVDAAIRRLREERKSIRCDDLVRLLESLGFIVRAASTPGHKVVKHPEIKGLWFNFNCGHGNNPVPLTNYVNNARRVLEDWRDELVTFETDKAK